MLENYTVCNCAKVSSFDIADALNKHEKFDDVLLAFAAVQRVTHCTTGCGGCREKVLDVISQLMMGHDRF